MLKFFYLDESLNCYVKGCSSDYSLLEVMARVSLFLDVLICFLEWWMAMQAYAELLDEENIQIPAWFSFNSKDGVHVVSGDSLLECVSIAESCKKVVSVGINCTPPRFIHGLIVSMKRV